MGFVLYDAKYGRAIGLYESESYVKGRVTKNNKQYAWEVLNGRSNMSEYAYCSWAEFEAVAKKSKRKGYYNYHEF